MSKQRPSVTENNQGKPLAAPSVAIEIGHLRNLVFGARRALGFLGGQDFANVANSILDGEARLTANTDPEIAKAAEKRIAEAAKS